MPHRFRFASGLYPLFKDSVALGRESISGDEMKVHQDQFDFGDKPKAKAEAEEQPESRGILGWKRDAGHWFMMLPEGHVFTMDDLIRAVGLPSNSGGPNSQNAVGDFIRNLKADKFIRWTGRSIKSERPERHAGRANEWQKIR